MDAAKAPHTVNSFKFLADKGFFDHTKCHRLTTQGIYVLQCGDPKGTGTGGPATRSRTRTSRTRRSRARSYPAGTVAMANSTTRRRRRASDTGGSQFFLVYKDSQLPPTTPRSARSPTGLKVLKKIAKAGSTPDRQTQDGAPNATVVIDKATVTKS